VTNKGKPLKYTLRPFVKDLKYYLTDEDFLPIFPGQRPSVPVNNRFLDITASLRAAIERTSDFHNDALVTGLAGIGAHTTIVGRYVEVTQEVLDQRRERLGIRAA
jgi:hypothetical protein